MLRKSLINLLAVTAVLCSCSRYQYVSVSSSIDQNVEKEFVTENDTIQIKYSFSGENFPVSIRLYNKLYQPIYIDLLRSSVVINEQQINEPFNYDGQVGFIAPQSYVTIRSIPLRTQFIEFDSQESTRDIRVGSGAGTQYTFGNSTSPIRFRSILAIATNEYYDQPTFYDFSFWVSDIIQTTYEPSKEQKKISDRFYIGKPTGFGKVAGSAGLLFLVFIAALAGI